MRKIFVMVSLAVGMVAQAQEADTVKTYSLQDVQVVSTRATKKTPMAFTNMSQEAIKAVNFGQDVPYILSLTPSITMTSDAGNGIGYTSLRVRGTDPSRINITANGIPLNDAESSTVFWVNMGDFASSVKSMQIQRGVGTSTNGAGAFGATLNMLTENVGVKPFVGIDVSGGSYYSHKETLRFGTGLINGHWGLQGRLSNIGSKGYLDRASTKLNSYLLQAGYFGENTVVKLITWNGIEETYHAWNYTSKYEQDRYGRRYNSCGLISKDANGNPTGYYNDQTDNYHQQNYQLLWNQRLTGDLNMNVGLHYTKGKGYYQQYQNTETQYLYGKSWKDFGMSTDDTVVEDLVDQQKMDNDFFGAVASLLYDNHNGLQAVLGGGWNRYNGAQFGHIVWVKPNVQTTVPTPEALSPDFEYYRNNSRKTDFNIYGKVNYEFLRGLSAFVDLQYRNVRYKMQNPTVQYGANADGRWIIDNSYNFFNPKAGLNYDINRQHKVYLSYGIGHKEPVRNNFMQQVVLTRQIFTRVDDEDNTTPDQKAAVFAAVIPLITNPIVSHQAVEAYRQYVISSEGRPQQTASKTPEADALFERLIAPYKGNALYLDFWAMYCGPCKTDMLNQREKVERLKDKPVRFLYICDERDSSREKAEKWMQDNNIKGEHIFVSHEEWKLLNDKFQYYAVPFVTAMDKEGNIITRKVLDKLLGE